MLPELQANKATEVGSAAKVLRAWRLAVEWTLIGLLTTGALWLLARNLLASETGFGPVAPAWAATVLATHGALAMLFLLGLGGWLAAHVLPRLFRRDGLKSGLGQLALLAILVVTGFGLYYLADEATRPAWSTAHWLAGLVLPMLLLFHRR